MSRGQHEVEDLRRPLLLNTKKVAVHLFKLISVLAKASLRNEGTPSLLLAGITGTAGK